MQVRSQPLLRLHRREVLHVEPRHPAKVLHEPINQLGEMQRIPRRLPIVVTARINRCTIPHPPVRGKGERDEHRRPEPLAIPRGEHPPQRRIRHLTARQIGRILPPPSRTRPPLTRRSPIKDVAPHPRRVDLRIDLYDRRIPHGRIGITRRVRRVPLGLNLRPPPDQPFLIIGHRIGIRLRHRLRLQMPALPALRHPHLTVTPSTRHTLRFQRRPTRHLHRLHTTGNRVRHPHRQRPDAHPVLGGDQFGDIPRLHQLGQLRPRQRVGHTLSLSSLVHASISDGATNADCPQRRHSTMPRTGSSQR